MWVRLLFVSRHNFPRYVNVVFDCFYREAYKISYIENWSAVYVHVRSHRSLNSLHALSQSLELSWSFPVTTMFLSDCFASLLWWCRWWWWRWWWRDFQFRSLSWELLLRLSKLLLRLRCRRPVLRSEIRFTLMFKPSFTLKESSFVLLFTACAFFVWRNLFIVIFTARL